MHVWKHYIVCPAECTVKLIFTLPLEWPNLKDIWSKIKHIYVHFAFVKKEKSISHSHTLWTLRCWRQHLDIRRFKCNRRPFWKVGWMVVGWLALLPCSTQCQIRLLCTFTCSPCACAVSLKLCPEAMAVERWFSIGTLQLCVYISSSSILLSQQRISIYINKG